MKDSKNTPNQYLIWLFIFLFGFISGVGIAVYKMQPQEGAQTTATPQGQGVDHDVLHKLEAQVEKNPGDYQAWVQLGHLYFDSDQHQKAIEAYEKSMSITPGDANLWTDLGVMYRRTEKPEKAVECFDKAISLDPKHEPSRFNKSIVLLYDLNDTAGAIASFDELLILNPEATSGNGGRIADFVEHLKSEGTK